MKEIPKERQPRRPKASRILLWFSLLSAICLLLGLIDGFRSYVGSYHDGRFWADLGHVMRWDISGWLIWAGFIPLIVLLSRSLPIDRENWRKALLVFLPMGAAMALLRTVFPAAVHVLIFDGLLDLQEWLPEKLYILVSDLIIAFSFYLLVLAFGQAINYHRRLRENELRTSQLELQMSNAQLQALKAQLHPHFLFNALNSISALQREDTETAQQMTARLGDFLRLTLENVGAQEVTLRREIDFLKCYLEIEQVRFGERLNTRIEIEPDAMNCRVPNLILQPLVENSFKHGIANKTSQAEIRITGARENGWLLLEVEDNGRGMEDTAPQAAPAGGLGLSNTRARLEQHYGANFRFDLLRANGGGLVAALRVPYRSEVADPKDEE